MMNNTYSTIISESERAWSFQWARTLLALERHLSDKQRSAYLRIYSINMPATKRVVKQASGANDDKAAQSDAKQEQDKRFAPGLMIIKRMNYTHAERKRLVLGYWQVMYRSMLLARSLTICADCLLTFYFRLLLLHTYIARRKAINSSDSQ